MAATFKEPQLDLGLKLCAVAGGHMVVFHKNQNSDSVAKSVENASRRLLGKYLKLTHFACHKQSPLIKHVNAALPDAHKMQQCVIVVSRPECARREFLEHLVQLMHIRASFVRKSLFLVVIVSHKDNFMKSVLPLPLLDYFMISVDSDILPKKTPEILSLSPSKLKTLRKSKDMIFVNSIKRYAFDMCTAIRHSLFVINGMAPSCTSDLLSCVKAIVTIENTVTSTSKTFATPEAVRRVLMCVVRHRIEVNCQGRNKESFEEATLIVQHILDTTQPGIGIL